MISISVVTPVYNSEKIIDAKIIIQTKKGNKQIFLNNFFIKYRKTKLKKGELIKSIIIPGNSMKSIHNI